MKTLHSIHPLAKKLGGIEDAFLNASNDLEKIGSELAKFINSAPCIFLIGAGMSRDAKLPTAQEFMDELVNSLMTQEVVSNFFLPYESEREKWISHLSNLEFDTILGVLRILGLDNHKNLFNVFLHGKPTNTYAHVLQIAKNTNIRALFSTNFDDVIEKTAMVLGIELQVFASKAEFPSELIDSNPLPLFKLHGGVNEFDRHLDIQADFSQIGSEVAGSRLGLLKKYIKSHHLIVLGYGGFDYWDIYPILFEQDSKGIVWISHADSDKPEISTASECYELTRLRDNVERLLAFSPGRVRIKCNTQSLLKTVADTLEIDVEFEHQKLNQVSDWKSVVHSYVQSRGNGALVDFGNILAACGSLDLAGKAFDIALSFRKDSLTKKEIAEALLGRARTSSKPDFHDLVKASNLAEELQEPELYIKSQIEKAIAVGNTEERNLAISIFREAGEKAQKNKLFSLAGLCFANIGNQKSKLREFHDADKAYNQAEDLFRIAGDMPQLFMTLRNHAEMYAIEIAQVDVFKDALPLYLEALSISWGRKFNEWYKIEIYSRILVILRFLFPNPIDALDYIISNTFLNQSGLAEHLAHRIVEYGYSPENLVLEEWQHEMSK